MIAKILKPSRTMAGFIYNEEKVRMGKAELLSATNFPPHCMNSQSLIKSCGNFLDYLCGIRPDVKSRQFHATISVAGDELNKDQLKEVAAEYMKAMGYGDQPYLVFFHRDTDNNHIHIVSSRVRKDGKLIPDGNERRRSLETIKRICQEKGYTPLVTKKEEAAKAIEDLLNWKFKHRGAIHSILSLYGLTAKPDPKNAALMNVFSGSRKVGSIEMAQIDQCIAAYMEGIHIDNRKLPSYERPEIFKRKSVLYNKLNEYASKGFTLEEIMEFKEFRNMGFRIDHKVNVDSNQKEHHQWTVTDFVSKSRFDGSDVGIPIETLLRGPEYTMSAEKFQQVVDQILSEEGDRCPWSTMRSRLDKMGIKLKKSMNSVSFTVDDKFFLYIDRDQVRALMYWERVKSAREFKIHNQDEARVLAILHGVKLMDIIPSAYESMDDLDRQLALDALRGRFQTFFQANEQLNLLLEKKEQAPDKKLTSEEAERVKMLRKTMHQQFKESEMKNPEAFIKDGDRYFFYSSKTGVVDMDEVIGRKLSDAELKAIGRPIIDLAVINRSQGRWLKYINQIIEEGGSVGVEKTYDKSGYKYADELDQAYWEAREAKKQEWELKKAAMEERRRSYTGPKAGSVRAASKREGGEGSALMRNAMRPTYLMAILKVCHDLQHSVGGGVAVTGGGRKRKRKRGDDDDEEE